jgi:hypothetical protein
MIKGDCIMAKLSDYRTNGVTTFTGLTDTPAALVAGKYLKVSLDATSIDQDDVNATSVSGLENSNNGFPYKFSTTTSGDPSGGYVMFDNTNLAAASTFSIHKLSAQNNNLSSWIQSWDDSENAVKGTLNISSRTNSSKFAMYKVTGVPAGIFGDGSDGAVTISGEVNINTDTIAAGRTYADGVVYRLDTVGTTSVVTTETPNGIVAGDLVMVFNSRGAGTSNYANVGNWEIKTVASINSTTVSFTESLENNYGEDGGNTGISSRKVLIQRVPQYSSMDIQTGATLTANVFEGTNGTGGIVAFKCSGTCTVTGDIDASGLGFEGGGGATSGNAQAGGSYHRGVVTLLNTTNFGGGCNGGYWSNLWHAGGGGGYGTVGDLGNGGSYGGGDAPGGLTYGEQTLMSKLYHGSGGGGGENSHSGNTVAGKGGGIVLAYAYNMDVYGTISADGANSTSPGSSNWPAGAGAGGSILLNASIFRPNASTLSAGGGTGVKTDQPTSLYGGDGGDGRIAVYYESITGSLNDDPSAYTDTLDVGNSDIFSFIVTWLTNNGTFVAEENVLVAYQFNY